MNKKIEVEIRGPLTKNQYYYLNKVFSKNGKFISPKNRIVLCYPDPETGSLVENCNTDIRIRTTNGIPELIIKQGKWGGDEHRREFSLLAEKGDFDKLVMMLGAMGFKKGVLAERYGKIYIYKKIEFSLVKVPKHSYYFEAEIMVKAKKDIKKAKEKMRRVCKNLGLEVWDDKGFYKYIHTLNNEANEIFDYEKYKEGDFKKRFKI